MNPVKKMRNDFFKMTHRSSKSKARTGVIRTPHGEIKTPSFVPVATKATLKALPSQSATDIGLQVAFVNTYHLAVHPGTDIIKRAGGVHNFSKLDIPLMSDSGGFQVFSLAESVSKKAKTRAGEDALVLKIDDDGVLFRSTLNGDKLLFTPESSIEHQIKIGADLIMAFDECTFYPAEHKYTKRSMERTHDWLLRCIKYFRKFYESTQQKQFLYGIIQGGSYEDLRIESAKFVTAQDIDGVAIGGVSVGESKEMIRKEVEWVSKYLPDDKPVHLLGIGQLDDFVDLIKHGIDTFDCVEPTRFAREGKLSQISSLDFNSILKGEIDKSDLWLNILKSKYKDDMSPVSVGCDCYTCKNFSKSYLHHLFVQKELTGHFLATYHNLYSLEQFFANLRKSIEQNLI